MIDVTKLKICLSYLDHLIHTTTMFNVWRSEIKNKQKDRVDKLKILLTENIL